MSAFRTTLPSFRPDLRLDHQQSIFCFGSCFAEHMAKRLQKAKFTCFLNPFGIQYNPVNIAQSIDMILEAYTFSEKDLVQRQGRWFSLWHHSSYSHQDPEGFIEKLQKAADEAKQKIAQAEIFIFTLGTAYYYLHKSTNIVAANCHKLPNELFMKRQFTPEKIVGQLSDTLNKLKARNPNAKFIFTVSPIRHAKDGLVENTRSKAALHLSIGTLLEQFPQSIYFPSYEIMMDDLRDYRFYAPDMLHPTSTAIDYIWEHFTQHTFSEITHKLVKQIEAIQLAVRHRPFHVEAEAHQKFVQNTLLKIKSLEEEHSFLDFGKEKEILQAQLV